MFLQLNLYKINRYIKKMKLYLFLLISIISINAKKKPLQKITQEGDHFFSETLNSKSYILQKIQQKKSLLVFLTKKNQQTKSEDSNQLINKIKMTIQDNSNDKTTCQFTSYTQYCMLKQVKSKVHTKITVQCQKKPCDITFKFIQADPIIPTFNKSTPAQSYYRIQKKNVVMSLYCNDSTTQDYEKKIKIYTNSKYNVVDEGNLRIYIFDQTLEDLLLIKKQEVQQCTNIKFQTNVDVAEFNKVEVGYVFNEKQIRVDKIPEKQLRIDVSVTQLNMKKLGNFNVSVYGIKDKQKKEIELFKITEKDKLATLDLNLIVKKRKFDGFSSFSFKFSSNKAFIIRYNLQDIDVHSLDTQQQSYFNLQKNEKIEFDVITQKQNQGQKLQAVLLNEELKSKVDLNFTCDLTNKCKLYATAKQSAQIGVAVYFKRQQVKQHQYIPLEQHIKLSLNQGQIKYLIHNNTKFLNKIITVSTSNVLVYAAGQKCPHPNAKCFEYSGSFRHTINIQQYEGPLYIAVEGLQLCSFILRVYDRNSDLELRDGVPSNINMQNDQQIIFKFRIKQKQAVNFNLIAPPNIFQMYVVNSDQQPDSEDLDLASSTGYLEFSKKQIKELVFTILIKQKIQKKNERFTIIASTKSAVIFLDRAQPHYDVFKQRESKKFSLLISQKQIKQKVQLVMNVDISQKLQKYNITLSIGKQLNKLQKQITIDKAKQNINIHQHVDQICNSEEQEEQSSENCLIYLELINQNSKSLDITLTILLSNSILHLVPGVWQSFLATNVTGTNHFYFTPTNQNVPIYLLFSHTFGTYKINYFLFDNKQKIKNAGQWPFSKTFKQVGSQNIAYQLNQYTIEISDIKKCFPDCILLVSLQNSDYINATNLQQLQYKTFGIYSIMATDSITQISQSQKIAIILKKQQSKLYMISLTQFLRKNKTLTFFCSDMIGYHQIYAQLTTNRLNNFPTDTHFDWKIMGAQFQLTTDQVNLRLKQRQIDQHQQIQLLLYVRGADHSKFIFEFTTKQQYIQTLNFGFPTAVNLQPNSEKFFTILYYIDYKLKITRNRGLPIISTLSCKFDDIKQCYQQLQNKNQPPMVSKTQQINIKHVFGNITLLRIASKSDIVHIQIVPISRFGSVQLKQGTVMTDYLTKNTTNTYSIHVIEGQDTIITITVFDGNPVATLKDIKNNITVNKNKQGNSIHFYVHNNKNESEIKKQMQNQTITSNNNKSILNFTNFAASIINRFQFNNNNRFQLIYLQMSDVSQNSSYSIVYTIGERHIDLIDGLLSTAHIKSSQTIVYNYRNPNRQYSIVSITFEQAQMLNNCDLTLFSYGDDESQPVQKKPQKLVVNKNTPKPSLTFDLESKYMNYEIKLKNKKSKIIQLYIIINYVDLVYLPFGYEYPSHLEKKQKTYFVVEVMNKGYVQVIIKKCLQTDLKFSYAVHDSAFLNQSYISTQEVDQNRLVSFIKAEESSLYFKLQSQQGVIYSILVNKYEDKKLMKKKQSKAGDGGQITYHLTQGNKALISFTPVVCPEKCGKINYYYLVSQQRDKVSTQTSCPGSYFLNKPITILKPNIIKYSRGQKGVYNFELELLQDITFLSIKAISSQNHQIAYKVIQIQTYWSGIKTNKKYHYGLIGGIVCCILLAICLAIRRKSRINKRYDDLPEMQA